LACPAEFAPALAPNPQKTGNPMRYENHCLSRSLICAFAALLLASGSLHAAAAVAAAAAATAAATPVAVAPTAIRIDAGASAAEVDAKGKSWLADQGFTGGDTVDRGSIAIANTDIPSIYRTEHYDMSGFSYKLPNGKYTVKLHFAETFEEISAKGQRVFSFNVAGHEFKDFDIFVKAGGVQRAYVETVAVEVTGGKLDIAFTASVQSPAINGIEIIPAP
jgi:hypothetical protein